MFSKIPILTPTNYAQIDHHTVQIKEKSCGIGDFYENVLFH